MTREKRRKSKRKYDIYDVLYYAALVVILFSVFVSMSTGGVKTICGYSFMTVLTSSMQDEIPQGSLVINKTVDTGALEIGDDITYLSGEDTTITHRIVDIVIDDDGNRYFRTQGIMNKYEDRQLVSSENVVGEVVFHNLLLGKIVTYIRRYIFLVILFTVVLIGLHGALKKINAPEGIGEEAGSEINHG